MKTSKKPITALLITPSSQEAHGTQSESLMFEDLIIQHYMRSQTHSSFAREWVEHEVEQSGDYFTEEIYKEA